MRLTCPIKRPSAGAIFSNMSLQFQHTGTLFEGFECSWRRSLSVRNQASSADNHCTCLEGSSICALPGVASEQWRALASTVSPRFVTPLSGCCSGERWCNCLCAVSTVSCRWASSSASSTVFAFSRISTSWMEADATPWINWFRAISRRGLDP